MRSLGREVRPPHVRVAVERLEAGLLGAQLRGVVLGLHHALLRARALGGDMADGEIDHVLVQLLVPFEHRHHRLRLADQELEGFAGEHRLDNLCERHLALVQIRAHVAGHTTVGAHGGAGLTAEPHADDGEALTNLRLVGSVAGKAAEFGRGDRARQPSGELDLLDRGGGDGRRALARSAGPRGFRFACPTSVGNKTAGTASFGERGIKHGVRTSRNNGHGKPPPHGLGAKGCVSIRQIFRKCQQICTENCNKNESTGLLVGAGGRSVVPTVNELAL